MDDSPAGVTPGSERIADRFVPHRDPLDGGEFLEGPLAVVPAQPAVFYAERKVGVLYVFVAKATPWATRSFAIRCHV
jgi:hypothetical protein